MNSVMCGCTVASNIPCCHTKMKIDRFSYV